MSQISAKEVQDLKKLDGEGDPLDKCKKLKFDHAMRW